MNTNFKNIIEFQKFFKDEETCRQYLAYSRWENGEPVCPFCNNTRISKFSDGRRFKCLDKTCNKKFTVTVGTIYENSKIPLQKWFLAVYLISNHKKGISSCQLARDLGITQKSAWFVLHRVREMLTVNAPEKLSNMVEIDETYIGGKYKNMHKSKRKKAHEDNLSHTSNKTTVIGLLERNSLVRTTILKRAETNIKNMVRQNVDFQATIVTDSFIAYKGLNKEYAAHEVVNHLLDEYVRGEWHTNTIEGYWSFLKRSIYGIYHKVSPKHLQRYCDENSYRYNTRKIKDVERVVLTLNNSKGRLTYKQLTGKNYLPFSVEPLSIDK